MLGVAPWASARTAREIDGQSYLIGQFLKDDIGVNVLQHEHLFFLFFDVGVVSACCFLLTRLAEVGNTLEVSNDACHIVNVL